MRSVSHAGPDGNALQLRRQNVEHGLAIYERSRAERDGKLITGPIVIPNDLWVALRDLNAIQRCHPWWVEVVQGGVDVPTIEASVSLLLVLGRDPSFVEGWVRRVLELRLSETFVVVNDAVADQLDLRHAWDGLEIRVKHGLDFLSCFVISVSVRFARRVERLRVHID